VVVAFAALAGSILMATHATDATGTEDTNTVTTTSSGNSTELPFWNGSGMGFGGPGGGGGRGHGPEGFGGFAPLEVSAEFKQTVTDIANNDTDVQNLLAEGYNVTSVRPIIKNVVDAEGLVTTKATSAILTLEKDTSGFASVNVDLEQAKVTQIVIMTRTVIDKT
jgi:hypothetical protein